MWKLRPAFLVVFVIAIVAAASWKLWQAHSAHRAALDRELVEAVRNEDLAAVEALLRKGARVRTADQEGDTPIQIAAGQGNTDIVRVLIRAGADVNELGGDATVGWTPLHRAARQGHVEVAKLLLDSGANVNVNTDNWGTPLTSAVIAGRRDVVELLVSRGADINQRHPCGGHTPLLIAANWNRPGIARWLLEHGADVDAANDLGQTPLMNAATRDHSEMVALLLSHHATLTLHIAAALGDVDRVATFLSDGAEVNAQNGLGRTPLYYAVRKGHARVAKELIDAGAEVNVQTRFRGSFLHVAASRGDAQMVRLLAEAGAEVNAQNPGLLSQTPLDLALRGEHEEVARILRDNGGKTCRELGTPLEEMEPPRLP